MGDQINSNAWQPMDTAPKDGTEILLHIPVNWGSDYKQEDTRIGKGTLIRSYFFIKERGYWLDRLDSYLSEDTPIGWKHI
ncbi:MAG: hypothetical protein U9O94_06180 [Nanoarchaeota archaeon]|nr:hypothetical protein [Nanoarchaeota archaeon]